MRDTTSICLPAQVFGNTGCSGSCGGGGGLVSKLCLTFADPLDCSSPRLLCPWDSPGKNTGVGCHPPPGDLPYPGIASGSPGSGRERLLSTPSRASEGVRLPYLLCSSDEKSCKKEQR